MWVSPRKRTSSWSRCRRPRTRTPARTTWWTACRYVFDVAAKLGRRAVVNLSSGARLGPHDAHGDFELRISDLLAENPEHIVVNSAGNLGAASAHARFTVPHGGSH